MTELDSSTCMADDDDSDRARVLRSVTSGGMHLPHRLRLARRPKGADAARRHAQGAGLQADAVRRHRRVQPALSRALRGRRPARPVHRSVGRRCKRPNAAQPSPFRRPSDRHRWGRLCPRFSGPAGTARRKAVSRGRRSENAFRLGCQRPTNLRCLQRLIRAQSGTVLYRVAPCSAVFRVPWGRTKEHLKPCPLRLGCGSDQASQFVTRRWDTDSKGKGNEPN